ncbi:hypothetical protein [Kordiimonas pumila]|uniref:Uncharacterized protein n=1 Tax=Kordiimonas pumila TaxID=2161677 RepID=A0ABV7D2T3_9PROT|nr:hypothetical protein [Kordiimonas pumila]
MKLARKLDQIQQHLHSLDAQNFDAINFEWAGIKFSATSSKDRSGTYIVEVNAVLGRLYFTAEAPEKRAQALQQFFIINRTCDGSYKMDQNGTIYYRNLTSTADHQTGLNLTNCLTLILLESKKHLYQLRSLLKPTQ